MSVALAVYLEKAIPVIFAQPNWVGAVGLTSYLKSPLSKDPPVYFPA